MRQKPKTLLQEISYIRSLRKAWANLNKSNPDSRGISGVTISTFQVNLDSNLKSIQRKLRKKKYQFSKLRAIAIHKSNKDIRPLRVAEIKDRVVIKAISNKITPILEKVYPIDNGASFAYRPEQNIKKAFSKIIKLFNDGKRVAFKTDIRKFFDTINQEDILKTKVFPFLPDTSLNELLMNGMTLEIGNIDELSPYQFKFFEESASGIPQGNSLSPLLSNIFLADFDQKLLDEKHGLVRYADDLVVMCNNEKEANIAYELCRSLLKEKGLEIHDLSKSKDSKTKIVHPTQEPLQFLSICFDGKNLWPIKSKYIDLRKKIRDICDVKNSKTQKIPDLLISCERLLKGWIAAFSFTDVERYFPKIDDYINESLSYALRVRNWKLKNLVDDKLSDKQRSYSGIPLCSEILTKLREKEKDINEDLIDKVELKRNEDNVLEPA